MIHARRNPIGYLVNEFNQAQEEFNRVFGRLAPYTASPSKLPINVWEDEHALYAEADMPGLDPAKLDVSVTEGNQLTIQGERSPVEIKGATWVRQECPTGAFIRVIGLPSLVDPDKVEASYEQGVLKLTLPKSEAAKPRKITVKAAE